MKQLKYPEGSIRTVRITCFTCNKDYKVELKSWQLEKKIACPVCAGKEVIILSKF